MKFLGTVLFMIILKATKTRHLTSLGRYTFAKTTGVSIGPPVFLVLMYMEFGFTPYFIYVIIMLRISIQWNLHLQVNHA